MSLAIWSLVNQMNKPRMGLPAKRQYLTINLYTVAVDI